MLKNLCKELSFEPALNTLYFFSTKILRFLKERLTLQRQQRLSPNIQWHWFRMPNVTSVELKWKETKRLRLNLTAWPSPQGKGVTNPCLFCNLQAQWITNLPIYSKGALRFKKSDCDVDINTLMFTCSTRFNNRDWRYAFFHKHTLSSLDAGQACLHEHKDSSLHPLPSGRITQNTTH